VKGKAKAKAIMCAGVLSRQGTGEVGQGERDAPDMIK